MDENQREGAGADVQQASVPPLMSPEPTHPADHRRAAVVALLNLSGLGLGYVVLRRWRAVVLCCLATGLLLLVALPADANGVLRALVAIYLIVLGIAAVNGALRALRTPAVPLQRPRFALVLAVALLAVPAGAVALYDHAQENAVQRMLLGRLSQADSLMASNSEETFDTAQATYESAFDIYRDLLDNHRDSQAGELVPGRLATFYQTVAGTYATGGFCASIAPLTWLRTLPQGGPAGDLGSLATWPDERLATSLYQCGKSSLGTSGGSVASTDLNLLLATFPASPQAAEVEPYVAGAISSAAAGISGSDPCTAEASLQALSTQVTQLTSNDAGVRATLAKDADEADQDLGSGTFACGVAQYEQGDYSDSQTTMNGFTTDFPNDPNNALAQKYLIAIQIAQADPAAGGVTPTLNSGGSVTVTIMNDSPDPVDVLYTGPATGSVTLGACSGCSVYSDQDGPQDACSGTTDYPQTTIHLPPGTTYILNQNTGGSTSSNVSTERTEAGNGYTDCAYETDPLLGLL